MPILHAVVLGLVQGLSEFLPISSSGHLLLVPWIFGWDDFESRSVEKAFDVALHVGTGVAVLAYFRHDIGRYVSAGWSTVRGRSLDQPNDGRVAWLLLASSIPAGLVGALLESSIDERLGRPWMIGVSLIGFGLLLAWADRLVGRRRLEAFGARDAWLLGVAQALALNPGTSRSGVSISAGP